MNLQHIIESLTPINTKEKVDTLIQEMQCNGVRMTKEADVTIRCAIQKASIQRYIIEKYGGLFVEIEIKSGNSDSDDLLNQVLNAAPRKRKVEANIRTKSKKKSKIKASPSTNEKYTPSILRVFGSGDKDKISYKERERISPHKKLYPTESTSSISAISIPMGGANKRY